MFIEVNECILQVEFKVMAADGKVSGWVGGWVGGGWGGRRRTLDVRKWVGRQERVGRAEGGRPMRKKDWGGEQWREDSSDVGLKLWLSGCGGCGWVGERNGWAMEGGTCILISRLMVISIKYFYKMNREFTNANHNHLRIGIVDKFSF